MTYTLDIPGWRPALASELIGCHWATKARLKKADARMVWVAAVDAGVPLTKGLRADMRRTPIGKRLVRMTVTSKGRIDPDAPLKSGLDALVTAGALVDDSAEWCEWERPVIERGALGTVIVLEDVAGEREETDTAERAGRPETTGAHERAELSETTAKQERAG